MPSGQAEQEKIAAQSGLSENPIKVSALKACLAERPIADRLRGNPERPRQIRFFPPERGQPFDQPQTYFHIVDVALHNAYSLRQVFAPRTPAYSCREVSTPMVVD